MKNYYVYILTNKTHTVFYTSITSNLEKRIYEHQNKIVEGFTKKYNLNKLVYFENYSEVKEAIAREKQIKDFRRNKKFELIESINKDWKDLSIRSSTG